MALHFINRNRVSNLVEFFLREQQESHAARDPSLKAFSCSFQSASASKKRRLVDSDDRFASACGRRQVEEEEQLQSESNITHTSQQSFPSDGHGATSVTHSDEAELANLEEELLCRGASDLLLLRMASAPPEMEGLREIDEKQLDLNAAPTSPSNSPPAALAQSSEDGSVQLPGLTNRATDFDQFLAGSGATETSHKRKRPAQQQTKTCLKCGKKFATGQALGGHMRKHWNGSIRVQTKQLLAEVGPSRTSSAAHSGSHSHESDLSSPEHDGKQRRANEAESTARPLEVGDIDLNLKI